MDYSANSQEVQQMSGEENPPKWSKIIPGAIIKKNWLNKLIILKNINPQKWTKEP